MDFLGFCIHENNFILTSAPQVTTLNHLMLLLHIRELQEKHKKAKVGEIVCVDALPVQKRGKLSS